MPESSSYVAGKVTQCYENWTQITTNPSVLSWIREGVPLPLASTPSAFAFDNPPLSAKQVTYIDSEIKNLLAIGAISKVNSQPTCVSPIHCVPKRSGGHRLIVDLRHLNNHIVCPTFRYEDINSTLELIQPRDQLVTVDLKSGFYHIPIQQDFRHFLGIKWRNQFYTWCVLPFGLRISPYYFHKVLRPIIAYLVHVADVYTKDHTCEPFRRSVSSKPRPLFND